MVLKVAGGPIGRLLPKFSYSVALVAALGSFLDFFFLLRLVLLLQNVSVLDDATGEDIFVSLMAGARFDLRMAS
jgi:hypothetical protein